LQKIASYKTQPLDYLITAQIDIVDYQVLWEFLMQRMSM